MTNYNNDYFASPLKRIGTLAVVVSALSACVADNNGSSSSTAISSSTPAPVSSSSVAISSSSVRSSSSVAPSSSSQAPASSSSVAPSSSSAASSVSYPIPANNFAVNGGAESGMTNWGGRANESVERTMAEAYEGNYSIFVSDRTAYWNGATFEVGRLTAGNEYEVAAWVKLAAGEADATVKITAKRTDDADDSTYLEYTGVAEEVATSDGWTLLRGTYTPTGETPFEYFIVEANAEGDTLSSYYVDQFVVAGEVEDEPEPDPIPVGSGLKDLTNIPVGVAVNIQNGGTISNSGKAQVVNNEFSQLSAENGMKMSYWYTSGGRQNITNMVQFARANNKTIHGHTLVWHRCYQVPSGWSNQSGQQYRQTFINHIEEVASQYQDVITSWDVVNEALWDGADDSADSSCGLQSGGQTVNGVNYRRSTHFAKLGADYIDLAFRTARTAAPNADLYYNDFNTENNYSDNGYNKTDNLVALIRDLRQRGTPIDGVGFQMHVGPDWPSISSITGAWKKILDLNYGLKIKLTEIDVRVSWPYGNPPTTITNCNDSQALSRQKQRYKDIIKAYYDTVPAELRGGITVWGLVDSDSWFATLDDGSLGCPLLFNDQLQKKPAYEGVQEAINESR